MKWSWVVGYPSIAVLRRPGGTCFTYTLPLVDTLIAYPPLQTVLHRCKGKFDNTNVLDVCLTTVVLQSHHSMGLLCSKPWDKRLPEVLGDLAEFKFVGDTEFS